MGGVTRAERRRRSSRTRGAFLVAFVLILAAGIGAFVLARGDDDGGARTTATATTDKPPAVAGTSVAVEPAKQELRAASTNGGDIGVYATPDTSTPPVDTLSATTEYLLPRTLLATSSTPEWVQVYLPTRPNSSTGWVKAAEVTLSPPLEWSVQVDLAAYKVVVLRNGVVEFEADAAIGSPVYPTPTGIFYITDPIDLRDQPGTGYGVFAIGLSGHSEVLSDFAGGDGQIAIHGTDNPGDIGQAISHGCVRLTNNDILRLSTLPLGTPVLIA